MNRKEKKITKRRKKRCRSGQGERDGAGEERGVKEREEGGKVRKRCGLL